MPDPLSNRPNDQPVDETVLRELYLSSADGEDYDVLPDEMADMVFPVALELQPGESLRDAAYRATEENGYRRTQLAIRLARPLSFKSLSAFTSVAHQEDISRIVDILGIRHDAEQLQKLLANSQVRSRQFVSFFGHHLQRADFSQFRRVSPRALRAAEYQRAIWSVRWLPCDPETMERLIDRCPVCHSNLGWQTTRGVSFCHRCTGPKTDLRDFPQPLVECNDPDAMRFVLEILDPLISDGPFGARWPTAYAAKTRAELYQFVVKLAMECQRHEERRRGPVKHVSSKSIERAGRALLDWPAGLLELADKHSEVRNDTRMLRYLKADASLSVAVRADIRALLEVRTRKMALAVFQGLEKPPGLASAAVSSVPRRNARTNMLELVNRPGHVRSGIEVAVRVVRDIRSVRLISHKIGVSVPDVIDLYLSGLLNAIRPDMSMIGIDPEASEREVDLIEWLETNVPVVREPKGMKLSAVKFAIDPRHSVSWPMVFRAALTGGLLLERGPVSDQGLLHDLYVDNVDCLEVLCDMPGVVNRFVDVSISATEVGMTLGKSRMTGYQLSRHFQWHSAATLRKLADLRQSYAFSFELMDLCAMKGVRSPTISTVLRGAGISRLQIGKLTLWEKDAALSQLGLTRHHSRAVP